MKFSPHQKENHRLQSERNTIIVEEKMEVYYNSKGDKKWERRK